MVWWEGHVHYRSSLDVRPSTQKDLNWRHLLTIIKEWVKSPRKIGAQPFLTSSLFASGLDQYLPGGYRIQTLGNWAETDCNCLENWSMHFEEPNKDEPGRIWQTDVGLERHDNSCYRINTTVRYGLSPHYVGNELETPSLNVPIFIRHILEEKNWLVSSGLDRVSSAPIFLEKAGIGNFIQRLSEPNRSLPYFLVTLGSAGSTKVNPVEIAKKYLQGAALVFVPDSMDTQSTMQGLLPEGFSTWSGAVRVYLPGLRFNESDSKRHRFISARDLEDPAIGLEQLEILIRSIRRGSYVSSKVGIESIEDVRTRQRERDWKKALLKAESGQMAQEEFLEFCANEIKHANDERDQVKNRVDDIYSANASLLEELLRMEGDGKRAWCEVESLRSKNRLLEDSQEAIANFDKLPCNLSEVVAAISKLYASKIVFLSDALKSAREWQDNWTDNTKTWNALWSLANILPILLWEKKLNLAEACRELANQSGILTVPSEGEDIKKNPQYKKLRIRRWKDKDIDISPHMKIDSRKAHLRIYFYADHANQLIVVGHCGEHLESTGTKKLH